MSISHGSVVRIFSVVLLGIVCVVAGLTSTAQANNGGWFSSSLAIDQQDDSIYSLSLTGRDCKIRDSVPVKGMGPIAACVTEGTKLRFAYTNTTIYISKGRDQNFYPLSISSDKYAVLSPDSDRVTVYRTISSYASTFAVYEDSSSRFTYSNGMYVFQASQPSFQYSQTPRFFTLPRISVDGRFAAYVGVNADSTKFAVKTVDLESGQTTTVGYVLDTAAYSRENYREIAVSDDGEYVAINTYVRAEDNGDLFRTVQIWRNRDCDVESSVACETRLATDDVPDIGIPSGLAFNDTATTLTLMNYKNNLQTSTPDYYRTTFSIEDIFRAKQLDYLALGDSFSSGEGDTKGGHYIEGTNTFGDATHPREMCHLSDRSYPFLLRDWLMSDKKVESVACSGAVVEKDYKGSEYGYKGQDDRLMGVPDVMRSQMKREALDISFIPGRNKQISFVDKYQPKAVTITGGGNDVGFAPIIKSCGNNFSTCVDATRQSKIIEHGRRIQSQYVPLVKLYRSLKEESSKTKVYAVGYPQFVSDAEDACAPNVGLDQTERKFIRESVTLMNNVIEAAANTVGVKYVDIESSLGTHTLCGGSDTSYVTGIATNKFWDKIAGEDLFSNESFHPNPQGHVAIANAIKSALGGKSPIEYAYCQGTATLCSRMTELPEVPLTSFFQNATDSFPRHLYEMFTDAVIKPIVNPMLRIFTDQLGDGTATVRMESTPITLGVVEVGADGVLDAEFTIPTDAEPGLHTLYIDAVSPSGEPVTLWQHVTVYGPDGDVDGNGVKDSLQPCPFITGKLQDSDLDGIDDRCDPEIEPVEQPISLPTFSPQIYEVEELGSSNTSTFTARMLLESEPQGFIQRAMSDAPTSFTDIRLVDSRNSYPKDDFRVKSNANTNDQKNIILFLSIAILMVLCVIAVFIYAKNHIKKS